MSNLSSAKLYIQVESVQTRDPVGESVLQTIAGAVNFHNDTSTFDTAFKLNGPIKTFSGQTGIDGIWSLRKDFLWEIYDVSMWGETMGISGSVEFDILKSTFPNGSFASIFTTKPSISWNAAADTTIHIGDTVANTVAPVLTSNPLQCLAKDRFKLQVTSMQGGSPRNFGIRLYFRGRT